MPDLTVFLVPPGLAAGVLDVLTDLSGTGLVDRFLWVTDGEQHPSGDHSATCVDRGRRSVTTVQRTLVDERAARVRLCVLVPMLPDVATVDSASEQALRSVVSFRAGVGVQVTAVRCLLAPPGGSGPASIAARDGWHNVLVAPEDSNGPDLGQELLTALDPVAIGRYAAPVVAGVMGLWTGMGKAWLDGQAVPKGVRVIRSYFRRVDAQEIERDLRARVLATQPELPQPRDLMTTTVYIEQPAQACAQMAGALWQHHQGVLGGAWERGVDHAPRPLGWRTALAWLWGFLIAAIRRRPQEWYDAKVAQFSSAVAKSVHKAVFGNRAAYHVVVNGQTPTGPATWQQIGQASEFFDALDFDPNLPKAQQPRYELAPLWNDYVAGAMTLCDGGPRTPALPPYDVGGRTGVLRTVASCVPAPEEDFTAIPSHLAAQPGVGPVQAGDVLGAEILQRNLQALTADPAFALDANRTAAELDAWKQGQSGTYAVQVGSVIRDQVLDRMRRIDYCINRLAEAAEGHQAENDAQRRRRTNAARLMIAIAVVAILAVVVAGGLYFYNQISLGVALTIAGIALVWWFVTSFINFLLSQRELFRALTRRRTLLTEVDALRINLRSAIRELRRLVDAYGQYVFITRLLGRFLRQPYGPPPADYTIGLQIVRGLPRTTRIARAEVDENAMGRAAVQLRQDLFATGWMREPWEATLLEAPARLGPRGLELPHDPTLIFSLDGRPLQGSPLREWGDKVVAEGIATSSGDQVWRRLRAPLIERSSPRYSIGQELLSLVRGVEEGAAPAARVEEFVSGIDQQAVRPGQGFLAEHFTADGVTGGAMAINDNAPDGWRPSFSGALVLVQYSVAVDPSWLRVTKSALPTTPAPFTPPTYQHNWAASGNGTSGHNAPEPPPKPEVNGDKDDMVF